MSARESDPEAGDRGNTADTPAEQPVPPKRAGGYNQGAGSDLRKALDAVNDYNKTLITIATGTVALTATFLKDLYHGRSINFLVASWSVLGLSVLAGMVSMGDYINQYAETKISPRRGVAEYASLVQFLGVLTGLGLFGYFAVRNATA
jgi:hypothetical protein